MTRIDQQVLSKEAKMARIDHLIRSHRAGLISRREFMSMLTALGVTALLSTMPRSSFASPKKGGHLRIGLSGGSTTDSLDTRNGLDSITGQCLNWSIRNNLTVVDKDEILQPELAESIESTNKAKVWRFNLRKGVEFHNGKTLTPEDVIASMNLHRGETKSGGKTMLEDVESIEKDGNSVVFRLSESTGDFPYYLSAYQLSIVPSKDGEADWQSGIGTGGYVLETYEPGVRALVKRNPNYWKPNAAFVDSAELLSITDPNARITAVIGKDVDVCDHIEFDLFERIAKVSGIRVEEATGNLHYGFPMHCNTAPFDNLDVRLAMKLAIDRESVLQKILVGHGCLGNDSPISPANQFFNAEMEQRVYDPEKAKFHLKKAGMEGLKVTLSTAEAAFTGAVDAVVLFKEAAKKAGIEIKILREPNDGYWSNVWNKKPFCASFYPGRPTADWLFSLFYASTAKWNDTKWSNEKFDKLLVEARAETDVNRRRELYYEMQQMVRDDGGIIVPVFANYTFAMSNKVSTNGRISGKRNMDGARIVERWSIDT